MLGLFWKLFGSVFFDRRSDSLRSREMHILVFFHDDVNDFRYRLYRIYSKNHKGQWFRRSFPGNSTHITILWSLTKIFIEDFYETCPKISRMKVPNTNLFELEICHKDGRVSRKRHWVTPEGTIFLLVETANFNVFILVGCFGWAMTGDDSWNDCEVCAGFEYVCFHPYLGKRSNLTNTFQMRWNHQTVVVFFEKRTCSVPIRRS